MDFFNSYYYSFFLFLILINLLYSFYEYKINNDINTSYLLKLITLLKECYQKKILFEFFLFFILFSFLFLIINFFTFFKILSILIKIFFYKINKIDTFIKIEEYPWNSLGYTVGYKPLWEILSEIYQILKFEVNKKSFLAVYSFFLKKKIFDKKIFELIILKWVFNIPVLFLLKCLQLCLIYKKFSETIDQSKTIKIKMIISFKNIFSTLAAFFKNDLKKEPIPSDYLLVEHYKIIIKDAKIYLNGKEKELEYLKILEKLNIKDNDWILSGSLIDLKRGVTRDSLNKIIETKEHIFFYNKNLQTSCSLTTSPTVKYGTNSNILKNFQTMFLWDIDANTQQYCCLYKHHETFNKRFAITNFYDEQTWKIFNLNNFYRYSLLYTRLNLILQNCEISNYLLRGIFSEEIYTDKIENFQIKELIQKIPDHVLINFSKNPKNQFNSFLLTQYELDKKNVLEKQNFLNELKNL